VAAAIVALEDVAGAGMLVRWVRDERSRLYRLLRKFSFLEPLPSWGPFISARVGVTTRDALVAALEARGVRVHRPEEPGLENYVRFGIGSRAAMEHLRCALVEAAPELLG
jgi:histidinol-phosphate/aromatic aminotransferase/cobyric acid decarboxylase-like protein